MVLRDKLQKRIGVIFFIFSTIVLMLNCIRSIVLGSFADILTLEYLPYLIYVFIFGYSALYTNKIVRILQVMCFGFEGVYIIISSPAEAFFGITLLFLSLLIFYIYGYFDKYRVGKGVCISSCLILLFSKFTVENYPTPILSSIMWVGFLWIALFVLWIIFKDYIEEHKNQVQLREEYLQESLKELQTKLEEYTEISHISLDTNKELLEIIRNHKAGGCDGRE